MGKLKINLTSGTSVEKPLISAFTVDTASYVILDNEVNGSMGLPIILVCKLENDKLVKIIDQDEWGRCKEYLKNIIAGNDISYISLNEEIMADDIYYTQLTLPVASFDALKNSYKVDTAQFENPTENNVDVSNEALSAPTFTMPEAPSPVENNLNETPTIEITPEINTPLVETPNLEPMAKTPVQEMPVEAPKVEMPVEEPVVINPIVNDVVAPVDVNIPNENNNTVNLDDTIGFNEATINPEPIITPTPVIDANINPNLDTNEDVFKEQKEAFMQACENMFDALVQKFKKELENK